MLIEEPVRRDHEEVKAPVMPVREKSDIILMMENVHARAVDFLCVVEWLGLAEWCAWL